MPLVSLIKATCICFILLVAQPCAGAASLTQCETNFIPDAGNPAQLSMDEPVSMMQLDAKTNQRAHSATPSSRANYTGAPPIKVSSDGARRAEPHGGSGGSGGDGGGSGHVGGGSGHASLADMRTHSVVPVTHTSDADSMAQISARPQNNGTGFTRSLQDFGHKAKDHSRAVQDATAKASWVILATHKEVMLLLPVFICAGIFLLVVCVFTLCGRSIPALRYTSEENVRPKQSEQCASAFGTRDPSFRLFWPLTSHPARSPPPPHFQHCAPPPLLAPVPSHLLNPGMQPGMNPVMQGMPPGMQPPGMQPPGMQPPSMMPLGMQPGVQGMPPGMRPTGMPPGMQPPGMPPGMQPGMQGMWADQDDYDYEDVPAYEDYPEADGPMDDYEVDAYEFMPPLYAGANAPDRGVVTMDFPRPEVSTPLDNNDDKEFYNPWDSGNILGSLAEQIDPTPEFLVTNPYDAQVGDAHMLPPGGGDSIPLPAAAAGSFIRSGQNPYDSVAYPGPAQTREEPATPHFG